MSGGRVPLAGVVDVTLPSVARMNDYLLGGKDHYPADRAACEDLVQLAPGTRKLTETSHRFLLRAVRRMALGFGVRQFVCFGAGLPTQVTVHQVAQRADPRARVVYVDDDPLVVAHGRAVLEDGRSTLMVQSASFDAAHVLELEAVGRVIDVRRPVAVLFVSVLQHLPGEGVCAQVLGDVAQHLAPGSFLAASQRVSDDAQMRRRIGDLMQEHAVPGWRHVRAPEAVDRIFGHWRLLAPGLADVARWGGTECLAPPQRGREWFEYGGVARIL
uniref:SAM-dependent methyltransferase n=1 Tax=Streptomyces sp. NBC_00119 TaxID=2975659 RepID=A0AAU1TWB0_9ACTN